MGKLLYFILVHVMSSLKQKKTTKQKILESGAVIFTEKGFANTSIAEICEMAGANIASVNYHFRSKGALYRAVLRYTFAQSEELFPQNFEHKENGEVKLYHVILSLLQKILSRDMKGNFYKLVAKEMAEPTVASKNIIRDIISRKKESMRELIREIYGKNGSGKLIARLTYSIISQCLFLSYNEKGRTRHIKEMPLDLDDVEAVARHITDFSLAGIRYYRNLDGEKV